MRQRLLPWYLWWQLVLLTGGVSWWLMNDWLEPKPVWTKTTPEVAMFFQYDSEQQLLIGQRIHPDQRNQDIVVLEAGTGRVIASLTTPLEKHIVGEYLMHVDRWPQLVGETIWRLVQDKKGDGSSEVQLRRWKYRQEQKEQVMARWQVARDRVYEEIHKDYEPMSFVWSARNPKLLLIYSAMPNDHVLKGLSSGFAPNIALGWISSWQLWSLAVDRCDVWEWNAQGKTFNRTNSYSQVRKSQTTPHTGIWSRDGKYYGVVEDRGKSTAITQWIDVRTGQCQPIETTSGISINQNESFLAGPLLMLQRQYSVRKKEGIQWVTELQNGPMQDGNLTWDINEWRPLYDVETMRQVRWPESVTKTVVGFDELIRDARQTDRYLYFSQVDCSAANYQPNSTWRSNFHFAILRYEAGQLWVERQWMQNDGSNCHRAVLCGQLIVQGNHNPKYHDVFMKTWLGSIPWLQKLYYQITRVHACTVSEIDVETGQQRWVKLDRQLVDHLPLLGKEYLLLRKCVQSGSTDPGGYECWKLPLVVYSGWWGPGVGLGVMVLLVLMRKRLRRCEVNP